MAKQVRFNFRLNDETARKIAEIAERQGGLKRVRVVELAVDRLWDAICGDKAASPAGGRQRQSR